jgi:hypothetical protein
MDANAAGREQRRLIWGAVLVTQQARVLQSALAKASHVDGALPTAAGDWLRAQQTSSCRPAKRYQLDGGRLTVGASRCAEEHSALSAHTHQKSIGGMGQNMPGLPSMCSGRRLFIHVALLLCNIVS